MARILGSGARNPPDGEPRRPAAASRRRIRPNVFAHLARFAIAWRVSVIAVFLALACGAGWIAANGLKLETGAAPGFAINPEAAAAGDRLEGAFRGAGSELIASAKAPDPNAARRAAVALAAEFEARVDSFADVSTAAASGIHDSHAVLFAGPVEAERIVAGLERRVPLFQALAQLPDLSGIAALAAQVRRMLEQGRSPEGIGRLLAAAARTVEGEIDGSPAPLDWVALAELDPPAAAGPWQVFATPRDPNAIALAREIAASIVQAAGGSAGVGFEGPLVERERQAALSGYSLNLAGILGAMLALVTLAAGMGRPRLILAVFIALAAVAAAAAAIMSIDGAVNDALTVFFLPVILLLAAEQFASFAMRAEEEEGRGIGRAAAIRLAAHHHFPGLAYLLLGAVGFAGWLLAPHGSMTILAQRTLMAIPVVAIVGTALLPALLSLGRYRDEDWLPHWADMALNAPPSWLWRQTRAILAIGALVLAGFGALQLPGLSLTPEPSALAADVLEPAGTAAGVAARLAARPEVASARTIADFLPREQDSAIAKLARLDGLYPDRPDASTPRDGGTIRTDLRRLVDDLSGIAASPAAAPELVQGAGSLARALARFDAPLPADEPRLLKLEASLFGGLGGFLERVAALARLKPLILSDLDPRLLRRFVAKDGTRRIAIEGTPGITPAAFAAAVRAEAPAAVGAALSATDRARAAGVSFAGHAIFFLLAEAILGLAFLWRWRAMAVALILIAALPLAVIGAMAALGIAAAPVTLIAVPLLAALAIACIRRPLDRVRQGGFASSSARRACLTSALATTAAFLPLILAPYEPLRATGLALTTGGAAMFLTALVIEPQLMDWFANRRRRPARRFPQDEPETRRTL